MNVPLITWSCIVAIIVIVFACRIYGSIRRTRHVAAHTKLFSVGQEWEEIYIPGDRMIKGDYDYDEFDDL